MPFPGSADSTSSDSASIPLRASQACLACRKQKRKCDKALPSCSLCVRMSRPCDYSDNTATPNADDFALLRQKIIDLEARLEGWRPESGWNEPLSASSRSRAISVDCAFTPEYPPAFPAMFFLDAEIFHQAHLTIIKPSEPVPDDVLAALGTSISDIQDVVDRYFTNIHTWLPIVSKKRMQLTLQNSALELSLDLALLLIGMKLIIQAPTGVPKVVCSPLYWLAKRYFAMVEATGLLSVQLLQAGLLISAYEIGHAIYPAAYVTTGHCARLGHALGLNDRRNAPQVLRRSGAWAEVEEMKRTWWATMLLDRYVNLGTSGHPLATDDPVRTDVLPADDALWDEGEMTPSEPLYVSSPTNVRAGPFARTCQATHLLGRLVRLLNDQLLDAPLRFTEALQLHRTLRAFANLLPDEVRQSPARFGTPLALCYGALIHLCDPFACTESNRGEHTVEETEMQTTAIAGLKSTAADVLQFSHLVRMTMATNPSATSPFIGDCLYQAAATYAWLVHESGARDMVESYHILKDVLATMNCRWAVAGQYLDILNTGRETLYDNNPLL